MAKMKSTFVINLPRYAYPRNDWRQKIYEAAANILPPGGIPDERKLELTVQLRMTDSQLAFHDVDNRLKDIMDALQGRLGGAGKKESTKPLIQNDNQIFRVVIEKTKVTSMSDSGGILRIMRLKKARVVHSKVR